MITVTFKTYGQYVRNAYVKSADAHRLTDDEKKEILSYNNISEKFQVRDWFGGYTNIVATIASVEEDKFGYLRFNINVNRDIPKHYVPSPSDILKGKNLLFPVSYSIEH